MSDDLSGFSLFDLFRAEAETHAATLSDGLLAVEACPEDLQQFEALMRAAHSLKGAARIVGLDTIVDLAHAMEDCFVGLQQGRERISPERTDQLLAAVDLFRELGQTAEADSTAWLAARADDCRDLIQILNRPATAASSQTISERGDTASGDGASGDTTSPDSPAGKAASADSAGDLPSGDMGSADTASADTASADTAAGEAITGDAASGEADLAAHERPPVSGPDEAEGRKKAAAAVRPPTESLEDASSTEGAPREDRTVPVNAENLNRIMRLAGESMIESRRLQTLGQSLYALRDLQRRFGELATRLANSESGAAAQSIRSLDAEMQRMLQTHSTNLDQALWKSEQTSTALYHEVIGSRMRPFGEGAVAFPRMIRDLARSLGKQVTLKVVGDNVPVDRDILRKLEAPLNHILRNCVDHGIESPDERSAQGKAASGQIVLHARHHAGMLTLQVKDNGRGIDPEKIRRRIVERQLSDPQMAAQLNDDELREFLFLPGFSTAEVVTEVSGRGVGLDVVRNMLQEVSGTVRVDSKPGRGTTFTLRLPVTLSVVRAVLAEISGEPYAFPLSKLTRILRLTEEELQPIQGRLQLQLDDQSVGLVKGADILELPDVPPQGGDISVVVLGEDESLCGLVVDRFCGEQDLVVRPLDPQLGKVPHVSAAAVTDSGEPLLFIDVEDLVRSIRQKLGEGRLRGMSRFTSQQPRSVPRVLVVDDSITVREVERQLLTNHGYHVDVAVDGQEGWKALHRAEYDLLITDVDMPRMNGIELVREVRRHARYSDLPIIIVSYKDREEDRLAGMDAGANAYLTKGSFHDDSFVKTVASLVGDRG